MDSTSLTPLEVAEILKITKNTVYELVKRGEIPAYKVGRKLRIDKEDVENYINSQKNNTPMKSISKADISNANVSSLINSAEVDSRDIIISGQDMILDVLSRHLEGSMQNIKSYRSYSGSYNNLYNLYNNKVSVASCHLWDWETGEYNTDFVKKMLPGIPCIIVNLTYRVQGFYVKKRNPKDIQGWHDLKRKDLTYVNRERGCGVRVLLDGKLRALNIPCDQVNGYDYEENSHLSVASAVARGKADFGIGIEKVSRQIDNVDFIPLQKERYDLVIKKENLQDPVYKEMLNILSSENFKAELEGIGGYDLRDTGKIISET